MIRTGLNYKFLYLFKLILIFLFVFLAIPSSVFAQNNQIPADYQQLQLLHQVQAHAISPLQAALLSYLLGFPLPTAIFPIETRLNIYSSLTAIKIPFASLIHPSPFLATLVILAWPLFFMLFLTLAYFLVKAVIVLLRTVAPSFLGRYIPIESKTFLEVTFPSDTGKSAYATSQLYKLIHTLARRQTFWGGLLKQKKIYSLEIASTKEQGIRYILVANSQDAEVISASLLSYLPGVKIKEVSDYLPQPPDSFKSKTYGITELRLGSHFALSLNAQKTLEEHDPISYLTGNMTKLAAGELISFQIIITPILNSIHGTLVGKIKELRDRMYQGLPLAPMLNDGLLTKLGSLPGISLIVLLIRGIFKLFGFVAMLIWGLIGGILDPNGKSIPFLATAKAIKSINTQELLNSYEQELRGVVKEKIGQQLFETSMRFLVVKKDAEDLERRLSGLLASFGPMSSEYQSITTKSMLLPFGGARRRLKQFQQRTLSVDSEFNQNPILSTSEISDIYHFPYTDITKTEGLVKSRSRELPAPLSLKKGNIKFDVLVGVNQYGGELSPIGLTLEQRQKHMYVIGKTGTGKTTLLTSSIYQDMLSGKGLAVFDPHGDMFQELLAIIPENRRKDVVVFDPSDRDYPLGLNLLAPGIKFRNKEDEHDWITSSVLAVFKKLADEKYWGPRMEHILRNATLTALSTPNPTFFTLQRLLTDKHYQKQVAATLKDPVLKQFWQKEFALMGSMQLSSVTAPLTQRLGSFISSKMSRHILLQERTTISIQKIMDEGKILLINLSKGDLGEDQSFFFGTILTSLIWMAAYQRTKIPESQRKDFFVYIDEFQNFATPQFAEITSEGRKFHVSLITSHQNIAQIKDSNVLRIVAGNAHVIVCTKASPDDEQFILPFMEPEVKKGDIVNLAPFNFFMKVTTDESEDAFSGKTVPVNVKKSDQTKDKVIDYTRTHYATPRSEVEQYLEKLFADDSPKSKKTKKRQGIRRIKQTTMAKKPGRRK